MLSAGPQNNLWCAILFNQDGSKVFTASCDKTAKMWDLNSNQAMQIAQVGWEPPDQVCGHKNEAESSDSSHHLPSQHDGPIKAIHWIKAPNYSCIMTGSWDKTLKVHEPFQHIFWCLKRHTLSFDVVLQSGKSCAKLNFFAWWSCIFLIIIIIFCQIHPCWHNCCVSGVVPFKWIRLLHFFHTVLLSVWTQPKACVGHYTSKTPSYLW